MQEPLTVTQLNTRVKGMLQSSPGLSDIWVSGEISNLTRASSGHYYFTLKDSGSEIRCAMFARSRSRIGFEPLNNMKVSVFGGLDIYVQRGAYQFIVESMRQSGVGDLYRQYEELKRKLQEEGLFDYSRKKPIPRYPRRIGVVTSDTGAVIHDIITTSASRFPADIILAPAQVQGVGAAATIVKGIKLLERTGVDVIIVGRGGGSIEDLWPFNEESVARAIAECPIPIVSAVGHETDFTIADFVADLRAPTPTGAAALILRDKTEVRAQIDRDMLNADKALQSILERMRAKFDRLDARLSPRSAIRELDLLSMNLDSLWAEADKALTDALFDMRSRFLIADARLSLPSALRDIASRRSALDSMYGRIAPNAALRRIDEKRAELGSVWQDVASKMTFRMSSESGALDAISARLEALDPLAVLDRGYGMVVGSDGHAVSSAASLSTGERIEIRFKDGSAKASVESIEEKI